MHFVYVFVCLLQTQDTVILPRLCVLVVCLFIFFHGVVTVKCIAQ